MDHPRSALGDAPSGSALSPSRGSHPQPGEAGSAVAREKLLALIRRSKRWDMIFGIVGLLAMAVGILTLVALFAEMVVDGFPRLSAEFFTSFPSRRPAGAGILSAWVGSLFVMMVTALFAIPIGIAGAL